ncbi:unnamed protein product [Caenorhabditis auriculariae]|uniref:Uncharacterized protein n=1 Tax=Caenorhabditis auriculariae TaxID=2777116 RepID=A0A8S1GR64_9PELO|nr:unnamed protein product [Caenorhabditis auriculariae]
MCQSINVSFLLISINRILDTSQTQCNSEKMCISKLRNKRNDSGRIMVSSDQFQIAKQTSLKEKKTESDKDTGRNNGSKKAKTDEEITQEEDPSVSVDRMNQVCKAYGAAPNPRMVRLMSKHPVPSPGNKLEKYGDITFHILTPTGSEPEKRPAALDDTEKPKYRYGHRTRTGGDFRLRDETKLEPITEENYISNIQDMEYMARDMLRTLGKNGIPQPVQLKNLKCEPSSDLTLLANNDRFSRANLLPNTFISNAVSIARPTEVDHLHTAKDLYAKQVSVVLPPIDLEEFHEMKCMLSASRKSARQNQLTPKKEEKPNSKSKGVLTCEEISCHEI